VRRMKVVFSYDGSAFFGLQRQPGKRTIQGVLEHVLRKIDTEPINIVASGRTDAGVHALAQVAHFDVQRANIHHADFYRILQRQLPSDIAVLSVEEVPASFHARFSVTSKEYWYKFRSTQEMAQTPFSSRYYKYVKDEIDLERLNAIAARYVGTHDFTAFATMPEGYNCVRTIYHAYCAYDPKEQTYIFKIKGTGFTKYMVRILVGYMFEVYRGREDISMIEQLYESRDRLYVHTKCSPEGLYLIGVDYE